MSGVEGVECEDYYECEAGVRGFGLPAIGFREFRGRLGWKEWKAA
jgi:hypothetical protein